jgi:predicted transcriptional regulator
LERATLTTNLTAEIVAAYVSQNRLAPSELEVLIKSVHRALTSLGQEPAEPERVEKASPAAIRRSIRPDGLVSFIDGRTYKMLKRHLNTHGMTPAEYRERFGLPADYPLTAPAYSQQRSEVARAAGLGTTTRRRSR